MTEDKGVSDVNTRGVGPQPNVKALQEGYQPIDPIVRKGYQPTGEDLPSSPPQGVSAIVPVHPATSYPVRPPIGGSEGSSTSSPAQGPNTISPPTQQQTP